MMFLDTHVVVWLYAGDVGRIPRVARQKIEEQDLLISPMATALTKMDPPVLTKMDPSFESRGGF